MLIKLKLRYHGYIKTWNIPHTSSAYSKLSMTKIETDIALLVAAIRNDKQLEPRNIKRLYNSDMLRVLINKNLVWISGEDVDNIIK